MGENCISPPFFESEGSMLSILKEISAIACVDMPIGETWTISRCRYQSEDGAPGRL